MRTLLSTSSVMSIALVSSVFLINMTIASHANDYKILDAQNTFCATGHSPRNGINVMIDQKICRSMAWLVDRDLGKVYLCSAAHVTSNSVQGLSSTRQPPATPAQRASGSAGRNGASADRIQHQGKNQANPPVIQALTNIKSRLC